MERLHAVACAAVLTSGVSLSSHAGVIRGLDAACADAPVSVAPRFSIDEAAILTVALLEIDEPEAARHWWGGGTYVDALDDDRLSMVGLLGLCRCQWRPSEEACCTVCVQLALERTLRRSHPAASTAQTIGRPLQVAIPSASRFEPMVWRGGGWEVGSMNSHTGDSTFAPNAPTVFLPKSFILGMIGLLTVLVLRWRAFSR